MSQLGPKVTFSDKFSDTLSGVRSLLDSASLVLTIDNSLPSDVRMRHHFCRFGAAGRRGFLNCRCRITDYLAALCLIMFTSNFVKCLCVVIHDSITIICASLTIIILIVNYCKTTIVRHRLSHWLIDLLIDWTCQCSEKVMEFTLLNLVVDIPWPVPDLWLTCDHFWVNYPLRVTRLSQLSFLFLQSRKIGSNLCHCMNYRGGDHYTADWGCV